jgi:DNA-binding transcriptional LysR family regulator
MQGVGVGLLPVRVMQPAIDERRVKWLRVSPAVPGHHVAICYQIREFGPGLQVLVALIRELVAKYKLFV